MFHHQGTVLFRQGAVLVVMAAIVVGGTGAFAPVHNRVRSFQRGHHDVSTAVVPPFSKNDAVPSRMMMMTKQDAAEGGDWHENDGRDDTTTKHPAKPPAVTASPVLARVVRDSALALVAAAVVWSSGSAADAAMSGGRMGGSFAAPRSSGGGGMSRMAPSRGGGYGGGYGGGRSSFYAAPRTTIVTPFVSPFYNPFYSPIVPFYGGGVGAISYNRGPGLFDLLFLGGLGWFAVSAVTGALSSRSSSNSWSDDDSSSITSTMSSVLGSGTSVVRLSVALDVPNRDDPNSLLSVLDRLAATANTDSRRGVQTLTSQVALEVLRRKSSIQAAASAYKHYNQDTTAQRTFNQWSVQERSKFEQETVSKFGGTDLSSRRGSSGGGDSSSKATMAVVTLVLSIQGDSTKVPTQIRTLADVEDALRKIAADVKVDDCLTGAEILWTPQDRSEVLTRKDVVADYPELTIV